MNKLPNKNKNELSERAVFSYDAAWQPTGPRMRAALW